MDKLEASSKQKQRTDNAKLREIRNKALQNDLILDIIFSNLSQSDVKSCRVVCHKWNTVSKKYFVRLSIVSFRKTTIKTTRTTGNPIRAFKKTFKSGFPFTKFRFEGEFSAEDLETFFKDRPFIQELSLNQLTLLDIHRNKLPAYNVNNWAGLRLTSLVVKRYARVSLSESEPTKLIIPFSYLGGIQTLDIQGAGSMVLLDGRIAPTEIVIAYVELEWKGKMLTQGLAVPLNDYIDVTKLKSATLHQFIGKFRVDVTDCLRLEHLDLHHGEIVGWHNNLILKSLEIRFVLLTLANLPPSVKELKVMNFSRYLKYSPNENFPSLKALKYFECHMSPSIVQQCPNIVRLEVFDRSFDLTTLPLSVRTFATNSTCFIYGDRNVSQLEKLILKYVVIDKGCGVNLTRIEKAIDCCNPKTVVMDVFCCCSNPYEQPLRRACRQGFLGFLNIVMGQMNKGISVVLKMTGCGNHHTVGLPPTRHSSKVIPFPNKDNYFLCENGFRRSIDEKEFEEWSNGY